jgi:hypothetical protein
VPEFSLPLARNIVSCKLKHGIFDGRHLGRLYDFFQFWLETFQLLKQGAVTIALSYVISSVIVGVFMLGVGFYFTQLALAQA